MVLELYIEPRGGNHGTGSACLLWRGALAAMAVMAPGSGSSSPMGDPDGSDDDADSELKEAPASLEPHSADTDVCPDTSEDEKWTLEELQHNHQLQFPTGVPADVISSVEKRLQLLPYETPGCTLPLVYPHSDPKGALYLILAEELQVRISAQKLTTDCIVSIQGSEFVCVQYLLAHAMTPAALNFFQDAASTALANEWHAVVFNANAGGAALAVCATQTAQPSHIFCSRAVCLPVHAACAHDQRNESPQPRRNGRWIAFCWIRVAGLVEQFDGPRDR